MNDKFLRGRLRFSRSLGKSLGISAPQITYLIRDEAPVTVRNKFFQSYSERMAVEIYDPRNGGVQGHFFNSRSVFLLDEVILEPRLGLIYDLNGFLLAESTVWPLFQLFSSFPWRPKRVDSKIDVGNVILIPSNAYGHWLAEDLGPVVHLLSNFPDAKLLVSKRAPKYVRDFLAITQRDFIEIDGPTRVKNLLFISKSQDSGWMHPKDVEEIRNFSLFKNAFHQGSAHNSIYASRRNTKRSPRNENLIELEFQKSGFEVVALEELNFMDEIKLLAETKNFAGVHGSAHVNSIFMPEGASLLDIVNENYWTELGPRITDIRRQRYFPVVFPGTPLDPVNMELIRLGIERLQSE